jgi:hypothetical protein
VAELVTIAGTSAIRSIVSRQPRILPNPSAGIKKSAKPRPANDCVHLPGRQVRVEAASRRATAERPRRAAHPTDTGATGWQYSTPYDPEPEFPFQRTRNETFESRDYLPPAGIVRSHI